MELLQVVQQYFFEEILSFWEVAQKSSQATATNQRCGSTVLYQVEAHEPQRILVLCLLEQHSTVLYQEAPDTAPRGTYAIVPFTKSYIPDSYTIINPKCLRMALLVWATVEVVTILDCDAHERNLRKT